MAFGNKNKLEKVKNNTIAAEISIQQKAKTRNLRLIAVSMLLAILVFIALNVIQSNILNREEKIKVLVASSSIVNGTKITEDNFSDYVTIQERTIRTLPENYVEDTDKDTIIDRFTNREFIKNDVITTDFLVDARSYIVDFDDPIETSLEVTSLSDAVGGIIREGDIINIYSVTTSREKGTVSEEIMLGAYVTKAFDGSGKEISTDDRTTPTEMFNLIISGDAEVKFNESISSGTLRISKKLKIEQ